MNSSVRYTPHRLLVDGEMTVYTCGELKPLLLQELTAHPDAAELDLSGVGEIDTAGLQLLLAARRHASDAGRKLCLGKLSRAVTEVLELCWLDATLLPREVATGAQ